MRLRAATQADQLPEDVPDLLVALETRFARELDGLALHVCLACVVERRQSGCIFCDASFACESHAVGDTLHDLTIDALDVFAQTAQLWRAHAAAAPLVAVALAPRESVGSSVISGIVRPAASANGRSARIIEANAVSESDWSPSDNAFSGHG